MSELLTEDFLRTLFYYDSYNLDKLPWHSEEAITNIPILDFAEFQNLNDLHQIELLQNALKTSGIFYIRNFDISEQELENLINVSNDFFKKPKKEQNLSMISNNDLRNKARGFSPLNEESSAANINNKSYSDLCMRYSMGENENIFPNRDFQLIYQNTFNKMKILSRKLLISISNVMELKHLGWEKIINGEGLLRSYYYPDVPIDRCADVCDIPIRLDAHEDIGTITLIYQTPCPNNFVSLQGVIDGEFVDLPSIRGTIAVLIGTTLELFSKGKMKAGRHRVLSPRLVQQRGSNRTSSIFFYNPATDFFVEPFNNMTYPTYLDKLDPKGMLYGDWVKAAILKNFAKEGYR